MELLISNASYMKTSVFLSHNQQADIVFVIKGNMSNVQLRAQSLGG